MSWRLVRLGVVLSAGLLAGSCASTGGNNFVADNLPAWAGGLPHGTPPRQGAPGYNEYLKSIGVEAQTQAGAQSAQPETPPPRKPREAADEPIH